MRIYLASSWRNKRIDEVVSALRTAGHHVYDFREDGIDGPGFNWSDIDPQWKEWTPVEFREYLDHPIARRGFDRDMAALTSAEAVVLVLPCGRSAHLELGHAVGSGKPTCVLLEPNQEPELMYKMVDALCITIRDVLDFVGGNEDLRVDHFRKEPGVISKVRPA